MEQQVSVLHLGIPYFIAQSSHSLQQIVVFDIWLLSSTTHSILYLLNINVATLMPLVVIFRSP